MPAGLRASFDSDGTLVTSDVLTLEDIPADKVYDYSTNEDEDELIKIKCPDIPDGHGKIIEIKRSALMRSPTMADFLTSPHYLPSCDFMITFMNDPAVCFYIVQLYLEYGPDRFNKTKLRVHITMKYQVIDRFVILVRLHHLAMKLELPILVEMAYSCLIEADRLMQPGHLYQITSLIYTKKAGYDKILKEWCFKHISNQFIALAQSKDWNEVLEVCERGITIKWTALATANQKILDALGEENKDKNGVEKIVREMNVADQKAITRAFEGREKTLDELMSEVKVEASDDEEDSWEDIGFPARQSSPTDDTKAREVLGLPITPKLSIESNNRHSFGDNAKARAVMGIDLGISHGIGKAKRTKISRKRLMRLLH